METQKRTLFVTALCGEGHSQTLQVDASMGLEFVKQWAGLMDGTSPFYLNPPGAESMIGKCGICGSQIKCSVEDEVDRSARVLADGSPITEDHRELRADGQQKAYVVLSAEERAKGFVRPVRKTYIHTGVDAEFYKDSHVLVKPGIRQDGKRACGTRTTMGTVIAETYARDPGFYSGTFCCGCGVHLPLNEFVWEGTREQVGS